MTRRILSDFTYKIVGNENKLTENHVTYRGYNVAETFVEHMVQVEERLITTLKNLLPFKRLPEDEHSFQAADRCFIYHFIDSFQFKACIEPNKRRLKKFIHLQHYILKEIPGYTEEKLKLIMRKCVYHYGYMNSVENFIDTHLPERLAFYSCIDERGISEAD